MHAEIDEAVSAVLDLLREQVLVDLQSHCSHDHRSRRGDRRDDLSRDDFDLVSRRLADLVVPGTQVGAGGHEVDVSVGIVVFLELYRVDFDS